MSRPLISPAEAEAQIRAHAALLPATSLPLAELIGATLRERVVAAYDQPPFDRVTMDGIAFAFAAYEQGRRKFRVAGTQAAGAPPLSLGNSEHCIEVMTGAMLPAGCDCVVPVEQLSVADGVAQLAPDLRVRAVGQDRGVLPRHHALVGQAVRHPALKLPAGELPLVHELVEGMLHVVGAVKRAERRLELVGPERLRQRRNRRTGRGGQLGRGESGHGRKLEGKPHAVEAYPKPGGFDLGPLGAVLDQHGVGVVDMGVDPLLRGEAGQARQAAVRAG